MKSLSTYCVTNLSFINENFSFSRGQLEVVEENSHRLQIIKSLRAGSVFTEA